MNQPICPVCNGEMKLIPAGVSKKSGKPYDSFWGCKTYGCKGSVKINQPVAPQPTYAPQNAPQAPTAQPNQPTEQVRGMRIMNAMNNATAIITTLYPELSIPSPAKDELIAVKQEEWFAKIYNKLDSPF